MSIISPNAIQDLRPTTVRKGGGNKSGRKAHIVTMGCQMNVHDSEIISGMLEKMGYGFADSIEESDFILYNTCCVRENPERKVYGQVSMLKRLKDENPDLIIAVSGCMPQQRHELGRLKERLPHVDLIFGTHNIHQLPELLERVQATGERVIEVWHEEGDVIEGLPVRRENGQKAFVTIIYGCNYHCTYCIVPHVRGRERSRRPELIIEEVHGLAADGCREFTLLGQNVDAYGNDLGDTSLADLLWKLNGVPGVERLRFMTSHPRDITQDLIDCMADAEHVCEHLHLPVQAGSDRTLKRMGRRYTRSEYLGLVERIKNRVPGISITTDIIVGFPDETDEEFEQTMSLVREVEYDTAYTFIYSPRYGTAATRMADPIPEPVKRERLYKLIELQNEISLRKNQQMVGQVHPVLVEGKSEKDASKLSGRTRTNKWVVFQGPEELTGKTVPVRITRTQTWNLFGEMAV